MDNQELFVKIAGLLDEKLDQKLEEKLEQKFDEKLTPIMQYLVIIDRRLEAVEKDVEILKQDVAVLKQEMREVKQDITILKQQVNSLELRMSKSERNMEEVKQRLRVVEEQNRKSALITENEILPRLNTIESCYLDTYRRYQEGGSDMQALKQDMELVKEVVSHHSEQLKQIS